MPAALPTKALLMPIRLEQPAFKPMATLPVPEVFEKAALQPRAALVAVVQPRTTPATVGVAAATAGGVSQQRPVVAVEQATRTWPSVPTVRATGVDGVVVVTREPLALRTEQGMAAAGWAIQQRPEAAALQATNIWPSAPTDRAVGVEAAVPVTIAPLPVIVAQGIAAAD